LDTIIPRIMAIFSRFKSAWRRHGPVGFVRLATRNIAYYGAPRRGRASERDVPDELDTQYGTETSGIREVGALDVDADRARHATRYQPSAASAVRQEIEALGISPADFSFVDFGSGKGRVLLVAAEFPFRHVLGVEFSQQLHDVAMANIAQLPSALTTGTRVHSVHSDATEAELPEGDLVCYFYNPFGAPVMKPVVERLIAHRRAHNRIIVIYVDPKQRAIFENSSMFAVRKDTGNVLVLDTKTA
jgi:SAM-dependent methyltransferase